MVQLVIHGMVQVFHWLLALCEQEQQTATDRRLREQIVASAGGNGELSRLQKTKWFLQDDSESFKSPFKMHILLDRSFLYSTLEYILYTIVYNV